MILYLALQLNHCLLPAFGIWAPPQLLHRARTNCDIFEVYHFTVGKTCGVHRWNTSLAGKLLEINTQEALARVATCPGGCETAVVTDQRAEKP